LNGVAPFIVSDGLDLAMILTQPAVDVMKHMFGLDRQVERQPRLFSKQKTSARPFTSQAYAEQGLIPAGERVRVLSATTLGQPQPRKTLS
jgi:hypothetical protein